ncbi:MAG: orotate phosphoribosyltransferase [Cirrosporium novae-zelandiae]|nr:MAG: orotate phosphoribosyltransferase [Cirrosporium novae-zelandiae]
MASETNPTTIPTYKSSFLQTCISAGVLYFGTFTLKSGRQSPYFFNAGLFHRADLLSSIATAYARTILAKISADPSFTFDVLFGPAYKGIPLAVATASKLAELTPEKFGNIEFSFNRKEAKDHGEGGNIVGAALKGKKVLIVDDVVTAGTAAREAVGIIEKEGGKVIGMLVALDRMEKKEEHGDERSAISEIGREYGIDVLSVLTLDDLVEEVKKGSGSEEDAKRLKEYRDRYRATD